MQTTTLIQLDTTTKPCFHLCNKHLISLALHIDCPGFMVLPAGRQTLIGECDVCNQIGPRILRGL